MSAHALFAGGTLLASPGEDILSNAPECQLEEISDSIRTGQASLRETPIDDLIDFFNDVSQSWADPGNSIQQELGPRGLNFLLYWFRASHLRSVLDASMRGNRAVLDNFSEVQGVPFSLMAHPRGIICHWVSGNVPMLGMLSLVQGILTKNANIVKVASENASIIPQLLSSIGSHTFTTSSGNTIQGSELVKSVAAVYVDSGDRNGHEELSALADTRVAWGGQEAVESIMNLPRKYGCDDVVLGPRTSFMVIGREYLKDTDGARTIARRASVDASLFEQRGCNSPHTVFVETGSEVKPRDFAGLLAAEMERTSRRYPLEYVAPSDTLRVLSVRAEYDMRAQAFYPSGIDWTVVYSDDDVDLAVPCFNRTVFVRPVDDVMRLDQYCSHLIQSVGTALCPERKLDFARRVTAQGVDRCPDIGAMTLYEVPWDGMFVMDRFVRWCKL